MSMQIHPRLAINTGISIPRSVYIEIVVDGTTGTYTLPTNFVGSAGTLPSTIDWTIYVDDVFYADVPISKGTTFTINGLTSPDTNIKIYQSNENIQYGWAWMWGYPTAYSLSTSVPNGKLKKVLKFPLSAKLDDGSTLHPRAFESAFANQWNLEYVDDSVIPRRALVSSACKNMFAYCTNLKIDNLSPLALVGGSEANLYQEMFIECDAITSIREDFLPSTYISSYMYASMFEGTSLTSIPENLLHATSLGTYCYQNMFAKTPITSIPEGLLPTTNIPEGAYYGMFQFCSYLDTIPAGLLSHVEIANQNVFNSMFKACIGLTTIEPGLFAGVTQMYTTALSRTFDGCKSLTQLPDRLLSTMNGAQVSTFESCSGLTSLPDNLFDGVTSVSAQAMFKYCTALTTLPDTLFASVLANNGSVSLAQTFESCSGLTSLPAGLFQGMKVNLLETFKNCTGLTSLPNGFFNNCVYPTGVTAIFSSTFLNCSGLSSIPGTLFNTFTQFQNAFAQKCFSGTRVKLFTGNASGRVAFKLTGTVTGSNNFTDMFASGGNLTTPVAGTQYYIGQA